MTRALTNWFYVTSGKESLVLKTNVIILTFEGCQYHGIGDVCLMDVRLYTNPNNASKMHTEGKKMEGKTLTNSWGTAATTANTSIKYETTGKIKINRKEKESQ